MHKYLCIFIIIVTFAGLPPAVQAMSIMAAENLEWAAYSELMPQKSSKRPVKGEEVAATALRYKGVPYKYGGASPKGFDCSGLVWYVFDKHGKTLPRSADKQYRVGKSVTYSKLQAGDVVFFTTTEKGASHCGIYVGSGKFIHASSSRGVMVSPMSDGYWKPRYLGARRML